MPGKTPESPSHRSRSPRPNLRAGEEGGKTVRIVARTQPSKRDRFYRIAKELRLDAPNLVNCLVDALIKAYEARGEVAFPLRIELLAAGGHRPGRRADTPEAARAVRDYPRDPGAGKALPEVHDRDGS
jgi:hypothetical protein